MGCGMRGNENARSLHRLTSLQLSLPSLRAHKVRDWYVDSFTELRAFPAIKDAADELAFTDLLRSIYRRHQHAVPVMAMGVAELKAEVAAAGGMGALSSSSRSGGSGVFGRGALAEMPEIKSAILIPRGGHLPHDTDGKLLRMGHEATALVFGAQHLPTGHPRKRQLFEQARAMRLEERQGWLAVRTSEFPAGDLEGAAKASLAIATYHLELQELEKGREWLAKALHTYKAHFAIRVLLRM